MFWKKTIELMQKREEQHYTMLQNRINKISDFIQGTFTDDINEQFAKIDAEINKLNKGKK